MRHRPAEVVRLGVDDEVAGDHVAELEDEEEDGGGEGSVEHPHEQVVHHDADGSMSQSFVSEDPH